MKILFLFCFLSNIFCLAQDKIVISKKTYTPVFEYFKDDQKITLYLKGTNNDPFQFYACAGAENAIMKTKSGIGAKYNCEIIEVNFLEGYVKNKGYFFRDKFNNEFPYYIEEQPIKLDSFYNIIYSVISK